MLPKNEEYTTIRFRKHNCPENPTEPPVSSVTWPLSFCFPLLFAVQPTICHPSSVFCLLFTASLSCLRCISWFTKIHHGKRPHNTTYIPERSVDRLDLCLRSQFATSKTRPPDPPVETYPKKHQPAGSSPTDQTTNNSPDAKSDVSLLKLSRTVVKLSGISRRNFLNTDDGRLWQKVAYPTVTPGIDISLFEFDL